MWVGLRYLAVVSLRASPILVLLSRNTSMLSRHYSWVNLMWLFDVNDVFKEIVLLSSVDYYKSVVYVA